MIKYPQLQVATTYSLMQSSIQIDDLIAFALANNHQQVIISDQKYMYGYLEFYKKAVKNKLHPIFGLQIQYKNSDLLLIAKNKNGYNNLVKISSDFSDYEQLWDDLFIIKINGEFNLASENFFIANELSARGIYVRNNKFLNADDYEIYCALKAISQQTDLATEITLNQHFKENYLNQNDNLDIDSIQLQNLFKVLNACEAYDPITKENILNFPTPENVSADDYLRSFAIVGLRDLKFKKQLIPKAYIERLNFELEVIKKVNFSDYFLIVHDFISVAKKKGIMVGPGRGSVAGSLVAYVLGITNIDPLKYNLYFERFLNPERNSMPDIDVDIMDSRRDEVVQYLYDKYSFEKVSQIVTFQRIKARTAIRDIGRILKIDLKKIDFIAKQIPMDFTSSLIDFVQDNNQLKAEYLSYPKLFQLSQAILNFPRQIGIHAAGVVLSNKVLGSDFPITKNSMGYTTTQFSMEYLEENGLIKMDLLGLRNLTTIQEIVKLVYAKTNQLIQIEEVDLNDQAVYAELSAGKTIGIFQLESPGMTRLTRDFKPKSIEDISLISALYRPGPQKHIPYFLKCRHENHKPLLIDEKINDIVQPTYGIIVYQEQVIAVVVRVMNCTLAKADLFRRAISKKNEAELNELKSEFFQKALNNNYSEKSVNEIWNFIYEFANYGFNHSHSVAYAYISYWLMWLKKYYPLEFYCTLLSSFTKSAEYLQEARKDGINCLPPSLNYSQNNFAIHENKIYFGLSGIKGLGTEAIKKILKAKQNHKGPYQNYEDALKALINANVTISLIKILIYAGAFDELLKDKNRMFLVENLSEIYESLINLNANGEPFFYPNLKEVVFTPEEKEKYAQHQLDLLGVQFKEHKITKAKLLYGFTTNVAEIESQVNDYEDYLVMIKSFKESKTKYNKTMAWIKIEDDTLLSKAYPYFGDKIHLMQQTYLSNKTCIIQIEKKNKNIRIKDIRKLIENDK